MGFVVFKVFDYIINGFGKWLISLDKRNRNEMLIMRL